jgi:hypothetical protein
MWMGMIDGVLEGVPRNPERGSNVYILGGGGGAGKSSTPKGEIPGDGTKGTPREAVLVNADDFKEKSPLYGAMQDSSRQNQKEAASVTHEESSMIASMATTAAIQTDRDVIVDGTFDNGVEKSLAKLDMYRGLGAKQIIGLFFSCDTNTAQERALQRYKNAKKEGKKARFVPIAPLRKAHVAVSKNFQQYVDSGKFDKITLTDTNGAIGEEFKMFTWDKTSGAKILNSSAYQRFLDKANDPIDPKKGGN